MKKIFKILIAVPCSIFALILLLAAFMIIVPLCEKNLPEQKDVDSSISKNWMEKVDGSKMINNISIPGCHDAGTKFVQLSFFSKCQGKTIYQQLNDGYRYVDVRLGIDEDKSGNKVLSLMHGFTYCRTSWYSWSKKLDFTMIADQCSKFLEENPSETILFVVKQEHGNESVSEFQNLLDEYIKKYPDGLWYTENRMPSLKEVRGKIVLFRRYADDALLGNKAGVELIWKNQPGNSDTSLSFDRENESWGKLYVQDRYEYGKKNKWNSFETSLAEVPAFKKENDCLINFLSTKGTLKYGHPFMFASYLNKKFIKFNDADFYGWTVTDFGSASLAQKIYSSNF